MTTPLAMALPFLWIVKAGQASKGSIAVNEGGGPGGPTEEEAVAGAVELAPAP